MKSKSTDPAREFDNQLQKNPVAVIGLASLFPKATNVQEYWDNILKKIDCLSEVPASRWSVEDYYDPDPKAPDKAYNKRGGFIPDIDFDPTEFGLPPNILEVTDISQLLGWWSPRTRWKTPVTARGASLTAKPPASSWGWWACR